MVLNKWVTGAGILLLLLGDTVAYSQVAPAAYSNATKVN